MATEANAAGDTQMAKDIKTVIDNADYTLITDALGAVALVVMLFVGLSLPGAF